MLEVQQVLAAPPDGSMPLTLKAGLNTGPCIAVTLNDRLDYFGSTVNMAARLEGLSSGTDVIISRSVYEDAKVRELIESEGLSVVEFDMSLKGFEDERFELWRVSHRLNQITIMPALLAAHEVSKIYQMGTNSVTALDNVSLEIGEGEFVAIQGTSGSGKSTLLNMLGGLDHPTKGEVFFASRPLGPFSKKEMARYRRFSVGMIFQNFNLIPTMTARENVSLALAFRWFAWTAATRAFERVAGARWSG